MATATSFLLSSITPKTLILPKTLTPFFSLPNSTTTTQSFRLAKPIESISSRFVRNVAVSAYGQQEEDVSDSRDFPEDQKLFVGNLPFDVDSAQIAGLFADAGTVEKVEVIYDRLTGRSRGFGFVVMSTASEAEAVANQFNGYELDGRQLRVNSGPPPPRDSSPRFSGGGGGGGGGSSFDNNNRIHVSNLSWKVDDAALKNLFSESGEVVEAKVIYDRESGRSRGFGFVTFGSASQVNKAIESLDGLDFNGRSIRVTQAEARQQRRQF